MSNNIEAARVMTILDELLDNLRGISLVTAGSLESAEELEAVVGPELSQLLIDHREVAQRVQYDGQAILASSTLNICRYLRRNPTSEVQLAGIFQEERSSGMRELIAVLEKIKERTLKAMSTTMEEENSERDHFEEVCRREEKAGKERQTLEQQLRVERRERSKQVNYMTGMENRATSELDHIKSTSVGSMQALVGETKGTKDADKTAYLERETFLRAEVERLRVELRTVEAEAATEELAARKKKTKAEQEVQQYLGEYDVEMAAKEKELQNEKAVYAEVKQQLSDMEAAYKELREEAEIYAEKKRKLQEETARAEEKTKRLNKAAITIQRAWRTYHVAKGGGAKGGGKAEKAEKKGGKKKK